MTVGHLAATGTPAFAAAQVMLPHSGLDAEQLGLLVNDDDPLSRKIGDYYRNARHIPPENVIHLHFPPGRSALTKDEFAPLKAQIDRATPAHVQAYAVAWTNPYRVGCMSLTSALAFGFDPDYCSATCGPTKTSPYFDAATVTPFDDLGMRPAMMLAGRSYDEVKALIDRGVAADSGFPNGHAYLLRTPDKERNVRAAYFEQTEAQLQGVFRIAVLDTGAIEYRQDVLFYFTGLPQVPQLKTLRFLPGALADHLTSFGGQLTDSSQMSSLRWLEAGATASYGTVVEPCNHPQKFPFPAVAMFHYATGATAIEAYWKSVAWPGEGVFIGEPLARPFAASLVETQAGEFVLKLLSPRETTLRIEHAETAASPFFPIAARERHVRRGLNVIRFALAPTAQGYFRLALAGVTTDEKR